MQCYLYQRLIVLYVIRSEYNLDFIEKYEDNSTINSSCFYSVCNIGFSGPLLQFLNTATFVTVVVYTIDHKNPMR